MEPIMISGERKKDHAECHDKLCGTGKFNQCDGVCKSLQKIWHYERGRSLQIIKKLQPYHLYSIRVADLSWKK